MNKSLYFILMLSVASVFTSCGMSRQKQVSNDLRSLQIADLKPSDITVQSFEPHSEGEALLVANIHTAFLMKKNAQGKWEIQSVRVGDRRWEDAKYFVAALNEAKIKQARTDCENLAAAIEKYQEKMKRLPAARNIAGLDDRLFPNFLPKIIRLDPWFTEYAFHLNSATSYTIISAGPDRTFGTADDIRFER